MKMKIVVLFTLSLGSLLISSCIFQKNEIKVDIKKKNSSVVSLDSSISHVSLVNNQLIITGFNLDKVTTFKIQENSTVTNLAIESQTSTSLVANTLANVTFNAGKVFSFILSNAEAAATFTVDFSLCDSNLNGKGFDCSITPNDKEVLSYDSTSGKWKPRAINGLSYQGAWDASSGSFPATVTSGDYYIVSVAQAAYNIGDWIVYNGTTFDHINNVNYVTNVFGRSGVINATKGDYVLNKMGDVDLTTTPPAANQFLKYNGTNWVPATLSTTETDPTVTAFAKSALPSCGAGQALKGDGTNLSCVAAGSTFSGTANRAIVTDGSGALAVSSITDTVLGYLSGATSNIQTQLNAKSDSSTFVDWSVAGVQTLEPTRLNLTTANRAVVTSAGGVPTASAVTSTELGYLSGVTSAIQTQLNAKISSETDPGVSAFAKTALPTCGAGQVLKSDGTNFSCVADNTGAGAFTGTMNRVVLTDGATGALTTSSVTNTEVGYVSGVTGNIQTQLNAKQATINSSTALTTGSVQTNLQNAIAINPFGTNPGDTGEFRFYELVANGVNYTGFKSPDLLGANIIYTMPGIAPNAGEVLSSTAGGVLSWIAVPSAPVSSVNGQTGVVSLTTTNIAEGTNLYFTNARSIASTLTGYSIGANTAVSAADTTLSAMQKLEGQIASKQGTITAGTTAQYYRGDKTWQTLDTSVVSENTNLYFTNARTLGALLTGFSASNSVIIDTDSVLTAFGKSQGQINAINSASSTYLIKNASDTITGQTTIHATTGSLKIPTTPSGVDLTDAANVQYVQNYVDATGVWVKSGSDVYRGGGNVGIGTTLPGSALDVKGTIRLSGSTSGYVGFAPAAAAGSTTYTLPSADGTAGYVLKTNGAGVLAWADVSTLSPVTSVNGNTGAVSLTTTDIAEGTNLYFTNARSIASTLTGYSIGANTAVSAADTTLSAMQKLEGQIASKQATITAGTTAQYYRGDKSWSDFATDMRAVVLTGLSTATNAVIAATDSALVAFGKLQAQISAHSTSIAGKADTTNAAQTITALAVTGLSAPSVGADAANKTYVDSKVSQWTTTGSDIYYNAGKVGIGTSVPASTLHLASGSAATVDVGGELRFGTRGNLDSVGGAAIKSLNQWSGETNGQDAHLAFYTNQRTAANTYTGIIEKMRITDTGYVGIGTSAPGAKLDVKESATGNFTSLLINRSGANVGDQQLVKWQSATLEGAAIGAEVRSNTVADLVFQTNSTGTTSLTEKMRITGAGNVGIGVTYPVSKQEVGGSAAPTSVGTETLLTLSRSHNVGVSWENAVSFNVGRYDVSTSFPSTRLDINLKSDATSTRVGNVNVMTLQSNGKVGIGITAPAQALDVVGNIKTSGCLYYASSSLGTCASDERIKKDIHPFDLGLDALLGINPVEFKYNGLAGFNADDKKQLGVIAQDVEKVAPQLVKKQMVQLYQNDQYKTEIKVVDYGAFTYIIINSIKELYHRLTNQFTSQRREIASVNAKAAKLEADNAAKDLKIKELEHRLERIEKILNVTGKKSLIKKM